MAANTKKKVEPKFSDFRPINVPLAPLRMEIAALEKAGAEEMTLEALLLLIHKVVKSAV